MVANLLEKVQNALKKYLVPLTCRSLNSTVALHWIKGNQED